jgi:hypothetical protein
MIVPGIDVGNLGAAALLEAGEIVEVLGYAARRAG